MRLDGERLAEAALIEVAAFEDVTLVGARERETEELLPWCFAETTD